LLAQRAGGVAPAAGPAAATPNDEPADPDVARARLRDRIGELQARLAELDRAAAARSAASGAGIEDATIIADSPGAKSTD
jgi:hypothetical protein